MVALDDEDRPYVYRLHGVSYAPSAMTRLLASEPERLLGHHLRTDAPTSTGLAQLRADGATIPFVVEGGHYWTTAVVLPPSGSPNLPRGSVCPPALRGVDWSEARRVAANGGGYIGISPVKNRGSKAASGSPLRRTQARRRRRRCRRSETLRPQQQPLLRRAAAPWRPQNRGSPQSYRNNALLSPDVVLPVLRSQTTCDAKAPFEPRTAPMPTIDEVTDEDLDAFDALTQPSAAPAVAPDPPPAPLPPPPAPDPTETVGTGSAGSLSCAHWFGGIGCAAHQLPSPFAPTCYFDSDGTASDVFAQSFPTVIQAGSFADAMDVDSAFMRAAKCARVGFASPPCTDISVVNSNRDESSACAELTIDCVRALAKVQHEMFCLETVCAIASARGGHLLACLYAECDKAGYIPQLFNLDPLRLGGSQSRCRAYLILTRKDVHAARGPFLPPITYQVKGTPQSIRHLLDPVSLVPPPDAVEPKWTAVHMHRDPSHRGPELLFLSGSKHRRQRCYSIDSPSACLTTNTSWIFDDRAGVNRCRKCTTGELLRIQGLPPALIDSLPPQVAHRYIGLGTEGVCMHTMGEAIAEYLNCTPATTPTPHPAVRTRGRLLGNKPATHLKRVRHDSFPSVCLKITNGRLGFPTSAKMRMYGFTVPDSFFVPIAAMARARRKPREHTGRTVSPTVCVCDWKGRFTPAKGGGATSVLGFRHRSNCGHGCGGIQILPRPHARAFQDHDRHLLV